MYRGKYATKKAAKWRAKGSALAIPLIILGVLAVGSTLAILTSNSLSVTNHFARAEMSCQIVETFDKTVKTDVSIQNTSTADTVAGYIRATVLVNWVDAFGNIYGKAPVSGGDYTITYGTGWEKDANGYYYWPAPVAPGDSTGILIESCQPIDGKAPEGYSLAVDILTEIIQSNPSDAVETAWGFVPGEEDNG